MMEYNEWVERLERDTGAAEHPAMTKVKDGDGRASWATSSEAKLPSFQVFLSPEASGSVAGERTTLYNVRRVVKADGDVSLRYAAGQAPVLWRRDLAIHCLATCPEHGHRAYVVREAWPEGRDRCLLFRCLACKNERVAGAPSNVEGERATMIAIDDPVMVAPTPTPTTRCGCGKHDIDPTGDVHAQHRVWSLGGALVSGTREHTAQWKPNSPEAKPSFPPTSMLAAVGIGVSSPTPKPLQVDDPTGDDVAPDAYRTTGGRSLDDVIKACRAPEMHSGGVVTGDGSGTALPLLMHGSETLVSPEQTQVLKDALDRAEPIVMKAQVRYHIDPSVFRLSGDLLDSFRRTIQATEDSLFTLSYE